MRPLPRPRPRWQLPLRRPKPASLLTLLATVLTFVFVQQAASAADEARARWGPTSAAFVTTADLEPGDVIAAGDVERTTVPRRLLPSGATAESPVGLTVRVDLGSGEIVLGHRLSGAGGTGLAAMLEPGERGVAVPRTGLDLPLTRGDRVDVLATLDLLSDRADPTVLVVERARVIAVDDEAFTLAVSAEQATTLTHALVTATVTLTLSG